MRRAPCGQIHRRRLCFSETQDTNSTATAFGSRSSTMLCEAFARQMKGTRSLARARARPSLTCQVSCADFLFAQGAAPRRILCGVGFTANKRASDADDDDGHYQRFATTMLAFYHHAYDTMPRRRAVTGAPRKKHAARLLLLTAGAAHWRYMPTPRCSASWCSFRASSHRRLFPTTSQALPGCTNAEISL